MSNSFSVFIFSVSVAIQCLSQSINYEKVIVNKDSIKSDDLLEKLISIAWENYPRNRSFNNKINQANENVKQAKNSWMNNLNVYSSFNSFNNTQNQNFVIVPNLGMGISINIGSIYMLPSKIKVAAEEKNIAENSSNEQKLYIRSEVIRRYNEYKLMLDLLTFQSMAAEEMRMTNTLIKKRFQNGEVSVEEYNKAFAAYSLAQERAITSESNYRSNKAALEELIGIKLEEIQ
ncbi:MAG: TolC family protein [Bacteroidota bacterium]|nr:TolC family protein [Bacteroidota bacterium]